MSKKAKVIFFIPGRIRMKISNLPEKGNKAYELSGVMEKEVGIYSVRLNLRTENLLVCYDPKQIDYTYIFKIFENILFNNTRISNELSIFSILPMVEPLKLNTPQSEDKIGKRVFQSVFLIGSISYLFIRNLKQLVSILVFSCPLAISISYILIWSIAMQKVRQNQIYVKNKFVLNRMEQLETVYIDESCFLLQNVGDYQPIDDEMYDFVFGLREIGITDIRIATKKDVGILKNISRYLGVDKIIHFNNTNTDIKLFEDNSIFVFCNKSVYIQGEEFNGIYLYVYEKDEISFFIGDMSIPLRDLEKIPRLIEFCRYCAETRLRCQNIAIAVNYFGIFVASLGYLGPFGAFGFYCMNLIWQPIYLENKVLKYEKGRLCCQITNS